MYCTRSPLGLSGAFQDSVMYSSYKAAQVTQVGGVGTEI